MVFMIHNKIIVEGDWDLYIEKALLWSRDGFKVALTHFTTGAYFYSWIASLAFSLFGTEFTLIRLLNCFLSTTVILNVYLITKNMYNNKIAKIAAWIMALSPTAIIFSSTFCNREPLNIFLLTAAMLYLMRWINSIKFKDFLIFLILYSLNIILHSGYIVGVIIIVPIMLIIIIKSKRSYLYKFMHLAIFGILMFLVAQILSSGNLEKLNFGGNTILEKLNWFSISSKPSRANYLTNLSINSYFDLLWQGPLRIVYFLLAPFPWMITSIHDVYGLFDAFSFYLLIIIFFRYSKPIFKSQKAKFLFIFALLLTATFSLATLNYGTALRHRAKFFPIYICLASQGIYALYNKLKSVHKHSN
jgi:4-amino-4-deoxy-L-arabinose transferase-like glycosyltransferase